jgi:hypothetical protein
MRHAPLLLAFAAIGLVGLSFIPAASPAATSKALVISVDDFNYLDTSNEPTDQTAAHEKRLQAFMVALRGDLAADRRFGLVPSTCAAACPSDGPALADRLRAASQAGTRILVVGSIQKMSTLIQWARATAIDTASQRVVLEKLFTFRGDSDEAWQRAEGFVSDELRTGLAALPSPTVAAAPIRLALFPFELEDTSAGAGAVGATASDTSSLADVTSSIQQLLAQSGRYQLVDVSTADEDAFKTHTLRACNGCDAAVARKLNADQSLVGVIGRVSRTEYIVQFQIRDARSGAVVANGDSGLRMGANYAWSRGAVSLLRDRLLDMSRQQ